MLAARGKLNGYLQHLATLIEVVIQHQHELGSCLELQITTAMRGRGKREGRERGGRGEGEGRERGGEGEGREREGRGEREGRERGGRGEGEGKERGGRGGRKEGEGRERGSLYSSQLQVRQCGVWLQS